MTVSKDAENRPGNSLPGFEAAYGKKEDEPSPRMEAKPRLIPVDRKQMRIVPVDVERLIPDGHEARAIWDFVGMLDLSLYYNDIASLEGESGRPAYDPRVLVSLWLYALSKGVGSALRNRAACEIRSRLSMAYWNADRKLSHPLPTSGPLTRSASISSLSRPWAS